MGIYSVCFTLQTTKPTAQVIEEMSRKVDERGIMFKQLGSINPFRGQVNKDDFKIIPNINYRNSWIPVIEGSFSETSGKSVIDVRMKVNMVTFIFMMIWYAFTLIGAIAFLASEGQGNLALIFLGFFLFMVILSQAAFRLEVPRRKKQLMEILSAEEE